MASVKKIKAGYMYEQVKSSAHEKEDKRALNWWRAVLKVEEKEKGEIWKDK